MVSTSGALRCFGQCNALGNACDDDIDVTPNDRCGKNAVGALACMSKQARFVRLLLLLLLFLTQC